MHQRQRIQPLLIAALLIAAIATASISHPSLAKEGSAKKPGSGTKTGSAAKSATQPGSATKSGFVSLFNGKDLDGWIKRGGTAEYHLEGDAIVGTSKLKTQNTFLCTPRDYADFILEVELKVDDGLNSGIQIRSLVNEEATVATWKTADGETKTRKVPAQRVHGYQVEIDPSDRAYSGGIYDEARRGWLNDLSGDENKAAREAFKRNEWNRYRIEAIGDSIKTWVNGVPAADLEDDMTATGFIGLQVHGIGNNKEHEGKQVRWRNIMLQEVTR